MKSKTRKDITMEKKTESILFLRVPDDLKRQFKGLAYSRGTDMKTLVTDFMRQEIEASKGQGEGGGNRPDKGLNHANI